MAVVLPVSVELPVAVAEASSQASTPVLIFDHLGLIVPDLAEGRAFLQEALGIGRWTEVVEDEGLGVDVQFGTAAGNTGLVYELVAPRGAGSPIAGQLSRGRGVLNHVAYRTANFEASTAHLRAAGCFATSEPLPALAYRGAVVQFWVSPLRFLIELIAKGEHEHPFAATSASEAFPEPGAAR